MSKEYPRHFPVQTTPEQILEEKGAIEMAKEKLSSKEIGERVLELAELSAARPEAMRHLKEAWGGLTKAERAELKNEDKEFVAAYIDALKLDPELIGFQEQTTDEYDQRIQELASEPQTVEAYKHYFKGKKQALVGALKYEHLNGEVFAIEQMEQRIRALFEKIGKASGPIERKKLSALSTRKAELIRVFIANKFFSDTKPEEFKIQGLSSKTLHAWQGKE